MSAHWRLLIALGVVTYLVVLVATVPARFLWQQFVPPEAAAAGLEGTAWRGRAAVVAVDELRVSDVTWRLRPLRILTGRLGYRLEGRLSRGFVEANAAVTPFGDVELRDVRAALPLAELLAFTGFGGATGQVSIDLASLRLRDGWPRRVDGVARVGNLRVADLGDENLGDFELVLSGQDGDPGGRIRDRGGPLEVTGRLVTAPDRSWEVDGHVRARDDASARLQEMLTLLGSPDVDGRRQFSLAGRL